MPQVFFINSSELSAVQQIALNRKGKGFVIVVTTPCGDDWHEQGIFIDEDVARAQNALRHFGEDQKKSLLGFIATHSKNVFESLRECVERRDKIEIIGQVVCPDDFASLIKSVEPFVSDKEEAVPLGGSEEWSTTLVSDRVFVFTGTLTISRDEATRLVEECGGVVATNISKGATDYLVAGDKPGSKLDKAKKLGIQILTPDEFFDLISEASGGEFEE